MRVVLANLEQMRGNPDEAREHLQVSSERIGAHGGGTSADWAVAMSAVEAASGGHDAAAAILESTCAAAERRGEHAWVATLSALLGELRYAQGAAPARPRVVRDGEGLRPGR